MRVWLFVGINNYVHFPIFTLIIRRASLEEHHSSHKGLPLTSLLKLLQRKRAWLIKTTMPTTNGAALLATSLPTSQSSTIWSETFNWSQGVITNYDFLSGGNLMK